MHHWLKQLLRRRNQQQSAGTIRSSRELDHDGEYRTCRDEGLLALAQGRAPNAIEALGRAALLRPADPEVHFDLGRAFELGGKTETARQSYLRALHLNPNLPEAKKALAALPSLPPGREDFHVGQVIKAQFESRSFRVLDIRRGGFGVVYIVADEKNQTRCALKSFQAKFLWDDEHRRRFEREALTWLMLDRHPNIVTARGLLRIEGIPCLRLDYLPYNLAQVLCSGPLTTELAMTYALQFCDGMSYAYQKTGILHRDIKPSNCLLSENLQVLKVTDFGLARAFGAAQERPLGISESGPKASSQLTATAGTPQYMSPEQFQPGSSLDVRSDIYSFGVMLYEMLTKDLPAVGFAAYSHITKSAPSHDVPEPLKQIILGCVAVDPRNRPSNWEDLRIRLTTAYEKLTGTPVWWKRNSKALELDYRDWNDKGIGLDNLGYHQEACKCYERALALGGEHATLWMSYGNCLSQLGRHEEALSCFDKGLAIDASSPTLWSNKGVVLEALGRPDDARDCYERAVRIDPRNEVLWMNLGANLSDAGHTELAASCYEHSLNINPRYVEAWLNMAAAFFKLGWYELALASCDKALSIQPTHPDLWSTRACALWQLRRLDDALAASNRALEIDENVPAHWHNKGGILEELGKMSEAGECLDHAQTLRDRQRGSARPRGHRIGSLEPPGAHTDGR